MERDDYYPFMKVSLNGECGVVTDQFFEVNGSPQQDSRSKFYGVIRWDTNKRLDFEDWRGLWGTFVDLGGHEIGQDYEFRFINNDSTFMEIQDTEIHGDEPTKE